MCLLSWDHHPYPKPCGLETDSHWVAIHDFTMNILWRHTVWAPTWGGGFYLPSEHHHILNFHLKSCAQIQKLLSQDTVWVDLPLTSSRVRVYEDPSLSLWVHRSSIIACSWEGGEPEYEAIQCVGYEAMQCVGPVIRMAPIHILNRDLFFFH